MLLPLLLTPWPVKQQTNYSSSMLNMMGSIKPHHQVLAHAVRNGHQFLFEQLLEVLHVDPNIQNDFFGTIPLHDASACGKIEMIKTLVETYHSAIDIGDRGGSTPLCLAIVYNQNTSLQKLLGYGASTEVECFLGKPIHIAVHAGNVDALRLLHMKNPDSCMGSAHRWLLQHYESIDCFKYLVEISDLNAKPLIYKVICCSDSEEKSLERIDILLSRGLNTNSYDAVTLYEDLPILCAARRGWKGVIEKLLDLTDRIPGVEWTVQGILHYVDSDPFKKTYGMDKERRVARLKEKLLAQLKLKHYLAANLICKALYVDMDKEEWDRFQSLCLFLIIYGTGSIFPDDINAATIRAVSIFVVEPSGMANYKKLLLAAKACLASEPENEFYRDFLAQVEYDMEENRSGRN